MLSLWLATAFSGAVLAFNPTPHPQVRSTWPNGIYPGENCLAYDGSKVPDCTEYIDPNNYIPYYHEHSQNCSRFWECGPAGESCLVECATCCREGPESGKCISLCEGKQGFQWALTFDDKFHFPPEGPTCVWPVDYDGDCNNTPGPCDCLPWQTCVNDKCSPQCVEDSHCPDGYHCDDCGWCIEDSGCTDDKDCLGFDAVCTIPAHDNCFYCDPTTDCTEGCSTNDNCPGSHPICGHGGSEHLCGCNANEDCNTGEICDTGDLDGDGDNKECIPDGCYQLDDNCPGHEAICNIPDHENCFYCDDMTCRPGCIDNGNCPEFFPICGYGGHDHLCGCADDVDCPNGYICDQDTHGCVEDLGCNNDNSLCEGYNAICNIPSHDNCFYCDGKECAIGCGGLDENGNCPEFFPICGYGGNDHLCGCADDVDCPNGYICDQDTHGCVEDLGCNNDNSLCEGYNATCNIPSHDNCFFCNGKDCAIGCGGLDENGNCPDKYPICGHGGGEHLCGCDSDADCAATINPICDVTAHECTAKPGKVLVDSIKIYTTSCTGCSAADEGVVVSLLGEKNGPNPEGVPCHTNKLDHAGSTDFTSDSAEFNGRRNGQEDQAEKNMMGGCYEGPLNSQIHGGSISWEGEGTWEPQLTAGVCVDWRDEEAFAWSCNLSGSGSEWNLVECKSGSPATSCP